MRNRGVLLIAAATAVCAADRVPAGLTGSGSIIEARVVRAADAAAPTVLLVAGLDRDQSTRIIEQEIATYAALPAGKRTFHLLGIPEANPDGAQLTFPPSGAAYRTDPASHYLWRWTGLHAPDVIIVAGDDRFGFGRAASANAVAGVGKIPARQVPARRGLLEALGTVGSSEARQEIRRRQARSAVALARLLEPFYGHEFPEAAYVPGMAVIARMRLGHLDDVRKLANPFVNGSKDSLARATASHLSGHLVFGELAERTGERPYAALVRRAADLGFNADGNMKESMPFHNEMSDSVFMACPVLAKAGKLTGERKYFDMTLRHFRFMAKLCRRGDGLYRHSPLNEAAWGRGNAFPALGLALALGDTPKDHRAFAELLAAFRELMQTLARFQDSETGMWRQVIDKPGSYPEFSATAMIGRSMLLGIRSGWLDEKEYRPRVDAAWKAVLARVSDDGQVVDVCESTGKQDSLEKYLGREAILGRDARGGGMAMMFAVEMAGLK